MKVYMRLTKLPVDQLLNQTIPYLGNVKGSTVSGFCSEAFLSKKPCIVASNLHQGSVKETNESTV